MKKRWQRRLKVAKIVVATMWLHYTINKCLHTFICLKLICPTMVAFYHLSSPVWWSHKIVATILDIFNFILSFFFFLKIVISSYRLKHSKPTNVKNNLIGVDQLRRCQQWQLALAIIGKIYINLKLIYYLNIYKILKFI